MLTGDHASTAERIGAAMDVTEVRAETAPEDKVAAVRDCKAAYGAVAMVGDGVNDAPALAAADVGIAMGVAGQRRRPRDGGRGADGRRAPADPLRACASAARPCATSR